MEGTTTSGPEVSDNFIDDLSRELGEFISSNSSTFTCGGQIPISDALSSSADNETIFLGREGTESVPSSTDSASSPIIIRWDGPDGPGAPVRFPIRDHERNSFKELVQACIPAGFGRGGQDVMDPEYRMAVKMDSCKFSTNLCPYRLGIIDQITNMLLPNVTDTEHEGITPRSIVVAELYKLNIYQGPSGFFKSHVDTPRNNTQFGSLVVCLPSPHTGGRLTVKHGKHEVKYDWDAPETTATLQWAAFYSDCEHEVHKVTDGHRVTLTYNLYSYARPYDMTNHLAKPPAPVQITNLPMHQKMKELLENEQFMSDGSDMALYVAFLKLGLGVEFRPVVQDASKHFFLEEESPAPYVGVGYAGRVVVDDAGCGDVDPAEWFDTRFKERREVTWITRYKWPGLGMVHGTYGNEAGIGCIYTYNALLVTIPPASDPLRGCHSLTSVQAAA